jgi:hypothetical protein
LLTLGPEQRPSRVRPAYIPAVDGCEYTIAIDDAGSGTISVQLGRVELAEAAAVVIAPAGTTAAMVDGRPGLPVEAQAPPGVAAAARAYQLGEPAAFDELLAQVGPGDAITVVSLAAVDAPRRARALARLAELAPPPGDITPDAAVQDEAALAAWRDASVAHRGHGHSGMKH